MADPFNRRIKLLTLVQDSSVEQKPGIVSVAKVQNKNVIPKKNAGKIIPAISFLAYLP